MVQIRKARNNLIFSQLLCLISLVHMKLMLGDILFPLEPCSTFLRCSIGRNVDINFPCHYPFFNFSHISYLSSCDPPFLISYLEENFLSLLYTFVKDSKKKTHQQRWKTKRKNGKIPGILMRQSVKIMCSYVRGKNACEAQIELSQSVIRIYRVISPLHDHSACLIEAIMRPFLHCTPHKHFVSLLNGLWLDGWCQ